MSFQFQENLIHHYAQNGYVVFRQIIPTSLLADLRKQAQLGYQIARAKDPNAQRIQPLAKHPELNLKAFEDYANLPALVDAIKKVVSPDAWIGGPSRMGILYEPQDRPWATAWHRDFGQFQRNVNKDTFARMQCDPLYFHQVNCALYEDTSTWYVPASHLRPDTAKEVQIATTSPWQIGFDQPGLSSEELERFCLNYVQSMPGGIRLHLDAGDFGLYRPHGYHLGNYTPYRKRATLHDSVWTPPWKAAFDRWAQGGMMEPTL
jgi:hypothetical protein